MCGISGFFYLNPDRQAESSIIQAMTNALRHRGPDSHGYFIDNNLALGHRRLSIIDLSDSANQRHFQKHVQAQSPERIVPFSCYMNARP